MDAVLRQRILIVISIVVDVGIWHSTDALVGDADLIVSHPHVVGVSCRRRCSGNGEGSLLLCDRNGNAGGGLATSGWWFLEEFGLLAGHACEDLCER